MVFEMRLVVADAGVIWHGGVCAVGERRAARVSYEGNSGELCFRV